MARKKRAEKDEARGRRFREICQTLFPGQPRAYIAGKLGDVSGGSIRNWELGLSISPDAMAILERLGASMDYLLLGEGELMSSAAGAHAVPGRAGGDPEDQKNVARVIGANLKHLRHQRFAGWGGQKKFADFLGISPNDLCVYEYGRSVPNEERLAMIGQRLELTPEQLRRPLPGVVVQSRAPSVENAALPVGERLLRERLDEMRQQVARLEGRLEAAQEQITALREENSALREANYSLRHVLHVEDLPEARARRERLMERLEPGLAELAKRS